MISRGDKPQACKLFKFAGFEIRVIERVTYDLKLNPIFTYEPMMTRKSKVGRRYDVTLVVGRNVTHTYKRFTASSSVSVDGPMIFDDADEAQYAAIVATWRWIQDGKGSKASDTE